MTAEADVIRLVQRADWTRLSLAAEAWTFSMMFPAAVAVVDAEMGICSR